MYRRATSHAIIITAIVFAYLTGCYKENPLTESEAIDDESPVILTVSPENGATQVIRNTNYGIRFDMPMDTASVSSNFHLIGGPDMHEWMDSLTHLCGMHGMGDGDRDRMMNWMDSVQYSGHFEWNGSLDSCVFHPDSLLLGDSDHMLFLDRGIRSRGGSYMQTDSLEYDACMFEFRTGSQ